MIKLFNLLHCLILGVSFFNVNLQFNFFSSAPAINPGEDDNLWNYDGEPYYVDATYFGNETRFINCSKWRAGKEEEIENCKFTTQIYDSKPVVAIVAIKKIKPQEEIILTYGERYWEVRH